MTETAKLADIVLPATMFLEHDDIYQGGGHQHIMWGGKLVEPPGECRSNHEVICDLAGRVGAEHRGFTMSVREIVDETLGASRRPALDALEEESWIDVQQPFEDAHFLNGFAHPGGKYRFKPDWPSVRFKPGIGPFGRWTRCRNFRSLAVDRGSQCRIPLPPGNQPGTRLPQFKLQRDAVVAKTGRAPDRLCPS